MHDPTIDGYVIWALVFAGSVYSMYLAGRMAERRGRSFKTWAGIAGMIGPLALPLLFLLPNQHRDPQGPARPNGEKPFAATTGAAKPLSRGHSDPGHLDIAFAWRV
jgi:MFS family permease